MESWANKIWCTDALSGFQSLPNNSLNAIVTSPPYWRLRDYGTKPIIFGGSATCEHQFRIIRQNTLNFDSSLNQTNNPENSHNSSGGYCRLCGGWKGQLGQEPTPLEYIMHLVEIFSQARRCLKENGSLWIVIGDTYARKIKATRQSNRHISILRQRLNISNENLRNFETVKPKDLVGIPWMMAFVLRATGWYLRQEIIWAKKNPLPESVKDRCGNAHEHIFLLTKSPKYYFDYKAIQEPVAASTVIRMNQNIESQAGSTRVHAGGKSNGTMKTVGGKNGLRNKRTVWNIATQPFKEAHFAVFPERLIIPCILAGCPESGIVYDPFAGSGTTLRVAKSLGRNYLGFDLNEQFVTMAEKLNRAKNGLFS